MLEVFLHKYLLKQAYNGFKRVPIHVTAPIWQRLLIFKGAGRHSKNQITSSPKLLSKCLHRENLEFSQGQKRYPKELLRQRFCWTFGWTFWCDLPQKSLFNWEVPRIVQKILWSVLWLWGSFLPLDIHPKGPKPQNHVSQPIEEV